MKNEKTYYSERWNFNIKYPSDWEIICQNEPAGSWTVPIAVAGPKDVFGRPCFWVNARGEEILSPENLTTFIQGPDGKPVKMPSTPEEFIEMNRNSLSSQFRGFKFLSGEKCIVAGRNSARAFYNYAGLNSEISEESVTVFGTGVTFQFISEVPVSLQSKYISSFKSILESFSFGPPVKTEAPEIKENLINNSEALIYNNAVHYYKQTRYDEAERIFKGLLSGSLRLQAAYAIALCMGEKGEVPSVPLESEEDIKDSSKVYLSSNIAASLITQGYPAALTKKGSVEAKINNELYLITVSSGFGFGGFFKMAWRKKDDKWVPISDPGVNPYPNQGDKLILSILQNGMLVNPAPFPVDGFKINLEEVNINVPKPAIAVPEPSPKGPKAPVILDQSNSSNQMKIGGWLFFAAFFIISQPIMVLKVAAGVVSFFMHKGNNILYWPSLIIDPVILVLSLTLGYSFIRKKSSTPVLFLFFLFFSFEVWSIALFFFQVNLFVPPGYLYTGIEPAALPFITSVFWSFILGPAFLISQRVEKTFTLPLSLSNPIDRWILKIIPFFAPAFNWLKSRKKWSILLIPFLYVFLMVINIFAGTSAGWAYDTFFKGFFHKSSYRLNESSVSSIEIKKSYETVTKETVPPISLQSKIEPPAENKNILLEAAKPSQQNFNNAETNSELMKKENNSGGLLKTALNKSEDFIVDEQEPEKIKVTETMPASVTPEIPGETEVIIEVEQNDFTSYMTSAEKGDPAAQCEIGWRYTEGISVAKDPLMALKWTQLSAGKGNAQAMNNMGVLYERGFGVEKDLEMSLKWYKSAAVKGNGQAMCNLGLAYENGRGGTAVNYEEAIKWYKKGTENGDDRSPLRLGLMYEYGKGLPKDLKKASNFYKISADKGNVYGQYNIGIMYENGTGGLPKDYSEAFRYYKLSAEQGNPDAEQSIGRMYKNGLGVEKDNKEAVRWYEKAVQQGHATAMCNLGWMYDNGYGVERDYSKAFQLYKQGALKGNLICLTNVASMYENGQGVEKNPAEAFKWYLMAAEKEDPYAMYSLGLKYQNAQNVKQDYNEAFKWFKKGADKGDTRSKYKVGYFYYNGMGTIKDLKEAVKWFELAANEGLDYAQYTMAEFYRTGELVQKDLAKAIGFYTLSAKQGNEDSKKRLEELMKS